MPVEVSAIREALRKRQIKQLKLHDPKYKSRRAKNLHIYSTDEDNGLLGNLDLGVAMHIGCYSPRGEVKFS